MEKHLATECHQSCALENSLPHDFAQFPVVYAEPYIPVLPDENDKG
jgi:hypothetical protein